MIHEVTSPSAVILSICAPGMAPVQSESLLGMNWRITQYQQICLWKLESPIFFPPVDVDDRPWPVSESVCVCLPCAPLRAPCWSVVNQTLTTQIHSADGRPSRPRAGSLRVTRAFFSFCSPSTSGPISRPQVALNNLCHLCVARYHYR